MNKVQDTVSQLGGITAIALDGVLSLRRRPLQIDEFRRQAWFITKVSAVPLVLIAVPFGMIIALHVGSFFRQLGAESQIGSALLLATVREQAPIPEILLFDEPDSGLDPVRTAFLNELILDLKEKLDSTFVIVTHHIPTAKNVSDHLALLYRRNLMLAGPKERLLNSDMAVVRQFLRGSTMGPIGMSEEKDSGDATARYDESQDGFSLEDMRDDEALPGVGR